MKFKFLFNLSIFLFFSCSQKEKEIKISNQTIDDKFDYLIFGKYCAEGNQNYTHIYKFDFNRNEFWLDNSGDFWDKKKGIEQLNFTEKIDADSLKFLSEEIKNKIPNTLLITKNSISTFGCPDCWDQCGIFFQFKKNLEVKSFYFDTQTKDFENIEIKKFAEFLNQKSETLINN